MRSPYTAEARAEARRLWVEESKGPTDISRTFGGKPTPQTVLNWANVPDDQGKTWDDYRAERADALIASTSPETLALNLMARVQQLASQPSLDPKQADALAKYVSSLRKLTDPAYQLGMVYQTLTGFLDFLRSQYPDVVTDPLIGAFRDYKNESRRRLGF